MVRNSLAGDPGAGWIIEKHQAISYRTAYIHILVSDRHFIFNLPPMEIRPLPFLWAKA
jgi:hypothetical protein